jgi:hypothetical protein
MVSPAAQNTTFDPQGNERPSWSFMSYQGKKFRRHLAWHGMITADAIAGEARDLVMGAMKRAEAAGLFTIFKVHDELVFEETTGPTCASKCGKSWRIYPRGRANAGSASRPRLKK